MLAECVPASRWWWHRQWKKPFFGRFMKPWRWPSGVTRDRWTSVAIDGPSGGALAAVFATTTAMPRAVVVCAHPMGLAAKGFWLKHGHAQALLDAGFHVVAFDFNGFGESPSTGFDYPGESVAVGRWAHARFPGLPVYALGASFGAMHTLNAIGDDDFPYTRVAAEACAPSLAHFWKHMPLASLVLKVSTPILPHVERRLRPTHALASMRRDVRVLLIHSRADAWTPVAHGDALAAAVPRDVPIERLTLAHAGHTLGMRDERETYWPAVLAFFSSTEPALQ